MLLLTVSFSLLSLELCSEILYSRHLAVRRVRLLLSPLEVSISCGHSKQRLYLWRRLALPTFAAATHEQDASAADPQR